MALLAWDAKIEMAGFRDPFADRTPRYLYSDAMVMGDPLSTWTGCKTGVPQEIQKEEPGHLQRVGVVT